MSDDFAKVGRLHRADQRLLAAVAVARSALANLIAARERGVNSPSVMRAFGRAFSKAVDAAGDALTAAIEAT